MKKSGQNLAVIALILLLLLSSVSFAEAVDQPQLDLALEHTARYIYQTVQHPQVGSIGGEWAILGLARSNYPVPDSYYASYYAAVEQYIQACRGQVHAKKYTEYSRLIIALTAIGKDPRNVAGYNLLLPLGDYEKTVWQGLNGPIWALIALDSGNYSIPQNPTAEIQATRDLYIQHILDCQLANGGFSLTNDSASAADPANAADPDVTSMALQALAKYQDRPAVKQATDQALTCLSSMQQEDGSFPTLGAANSESAVQVVVALCTLGISMDDPRFVKNGHTALDNLFRYYLAGQGFIHTLDSSNSNQMASEQGLYALVAMQRYRDGQSSLYHMEQATAVVSQDEQSVGLPNKHPDLRALPPTQIRKKFMDIPEKPPHPNRDAIEALAARGIISGKTDSLFDPNTTMSRAEFATIMVRGLGLSPRSGEFFTDVSADAWYADYVGTAYAYGIITGRTNHQFDPQGTITRQEVAVMISRAAQLAGMTTAVNSSAVRDQLAQFTDYQESAVWAQEALAFCYLEGLLDDTDLEIQPLAAAKRADIAQILFNLLDRAHLLKGAEDES